MTFPDVDRFNRREHMCLGFETDHNLFQCRGINGHAWAGRYIDPLSICQVKQESKLTVNNNINLNVLHLDLVNKLVRTV